MTRSFLTVLAAFALMLASLAASAHAMPMGGGSDHPMLMADASTSTYRPASGMSCGNTCAGSSDLACAFACAALDTPSTPKRPHAPYAYGVARFFAASVEQLPSRQPGAVERPPRPAQL